MKFIYYIFDKPSHFPPFSADKKNEFTTHTLETDRQKRTPNKIGKKRFCVL